MELLSLLLHLGNDLQFHAAAAAAALTAGPHRVLKKHRRSVDRWKRGNARRDLLHFEAGCQKRADGLLPARTEQRL